MGKFKELLNAPSNDTLSLGYQKAIKEAAKKLAEDMRKDLERIYMGKGYPTSFGAIIQGEYIDLNTEASVVEVPLKKESYEPED